MRQLSGQDAMFLHAESAELPQHIFGLTIYDPSTNPGGSLNFEEIVDHFRNCVGMVRVFRQKLVEVPFSLDQPYWLDDADIDVELHVHQIALPQPGDWRTLCDMVSRIHARPLARDAPLWEAYVIDGLNTIEGVPPGCFALMMKVHHAAMDGASAVEMYAALHDFEVQPKSLRSQPVVVAERMPSQIELITKAYTNNVRNIEKIGSLASLAWPTYRRIKESYKTDLLHPSSPVPKTRFNGRPGRARTIGAIRVDYAVVQAIRSRVVGATSNDVMLTIVAGGLRRYLQQKNELPKESLSVACPINLRSKRSADDEGNSVGFMTLPIGTAIADPLLRLSEVRMESYEAKLYTQALGKRLAVEIPNAIPAVLFSNLLHYGQRLGILERLGPFLNTVVTNVPGLPRELYLRGSKVVTGFAGGPLLPGVGLFHTVTSTISKRQGESAISFSACPMMLSDAENYEHCLRESYEELQMRVQKKAKLDQSRQGRASDPRRKAVAA
ncbi:MAG: wax ester/triacylglycerol synthase family O-acyltransferase [Pseudomonadota bacterium]